MSKNKSEKLEVGKKSGDADLDAVASEILKQVQEKIDPKSLEKLMADGLPEERIVRQPYVRDKSIPKERPRRKTTNKEFLGTKITPENRNQVMTDFKAKLIIDLQKNPDVPIDKEAVDKVVKEFVLREQKHYKAFLKNEETYWYKNSPYQVLYKVTAIEDDK